MSERTGAEGLADTIAAQALRMQAQQKLWLEPTPEMVQAGLAEVQRILDEWESDHLGWCVDDVTDDMASDMAVFVLQAMAGKLPKEPENG
ncbi:hypothetical protein Fifi067_00052 [Erwinia phage Fifi067]|nr:hypothetical protein Fifi067_00052 [Erwinia phage Fifi067]WBQ32502.1 hypothetical protein [Erwinia phage Kuerle]